MHQPDVENALPHPNIPEPETTPVCKNWRAISLGAAIAIGLGLYFFTLTAVIVGLICAFIGVAVAFYFLNGLQYVARSEGNNVTINRAGGHAQNEADRRNGIACICTVLGYAFFVGAHVAHLVGMLFIHLAYAMLSLHVEINCVARVAGCVKACAACFYAQEVHAAEAGTITTLVSEPHWWQY